VVTYSPQLLVLRTRDVLLRRELRVALLLACSQIELRLDARKLGLAFAFAQAQRGVVEDRQRLADTDALADFRHLHHAPVLLAGHARVLSADDAAGRPAARREFGADRRRHADDGGWRLRLGRCARIGIEVDHRNDQHGRERGGDQALVQGAHVGLRGKEDQEAFCASGARQPAATARGRDCARRSNAGTSTTVNNRLNATPPTDTAARPR